MAIKSRATQPCIKVVAVKGEHGRGLASRPDTEGRQEKSQHNAHWLEAGFGCNDCVVMLAASNSMPTCVQAAKVWAQKAVSPTCMQLC